MLGILVLPALASIWRWAPGELDVPEFATFNYRGGSSVTPEFLAL
jgi:general L-amino acid transport system permease protein